MTVFENARVDGAKNKIAQKLDKPEIQELLERKRNWTLAVILIVRHVHITVPTGKLK